MIQRRLILVVLLAIAPAAIAQYAQYGAVGKVINSKHDLSAASSATVKAQSFQQTCAFCHVVHNTNPIPAGAQTPLWNHQLGTTISGVYSSSTFNALNTNIQALGAPTWGAATVSHLCMSCHDGSIGVNAIYKFGTPAQALVTNSKTNSNGQLNSSSSALLGLDLSGSHPVNFTYDSTVTSINTHLATTDTTHHNVGAKKLPLDLNNKLQCATCHDPHDDRTNQYFLRDSLNGSQLCLDCHLAT